MCVCIAVFESILRVKNGDSSIWWVPLIVLSLFYNKIYKYENTESSIILNKIRSLLGGSSEHGFREHRPCYIHGRTHVGISDVAKCGKGILAHQPNKKIFFTVTQPPRCYTTIYDDMIYSKNNKLITCTLFQDKPFFGVVHNILL